MLLLFLLRLAFLFDVDAGVDVCNSTIFYADIEIESVCSHHDISIPSYDLCK